jgi:hypothetical protein
MNFITGSPVGPFTSAVFAALKADQTLNTLAPGGIFTAVPRAERIETAYVEIRETTGTPGGFSAMQREGTSASVMIHVWSPARGTHEALGILSRIRAVLGRGESLQVQGFTLISGSVVCENEQCFPDVDLDMQETSWIHGILTVRAELEERL